ncbi:MAG: IS200/IS605 family transposase [Verrucomicrobiota bacterium]
MKRHLPSHKWLGYFQNQFNIAKWLGYILRINYLTIMHSFNSCLMHCVFSTKERRLFLTAPIRERLWPYLGGIARENNARAIAIGGVADHVHLLLSLPATLSISKAMQLLKGNSSKWLRETFPELRSQGFAWQEGFGAFSIGISGVADTVCYIQKQKNIIERKISVKSWKCF